MTLIQRYTISSEYAELLSTTPAARAGNREHRSKHTWLSKHTEQLSAEKAAWKDALCPSLEELQAVFRRMLADPELSQANVFKFCAPLFIFLCLLLVGVVLPRHPELQGSVLRDAGNNGTEFALVLLVFMAAILAGLAVLRVIIWGTAIAVGTFVEKDLSEPAQRDDPDSDSFELSQSNIIIGGMFM